MTINPQDPARLTRLQIGLVAGLLCLFAGQAVLSMRQKSVTTDEIMYMAAGYYHLETGDFELNMTNTPGMKLVAALPLLALDPDLPEIDGSPRDWSITRQWKFSHDFLYHNSVDADRLLFFSRLPIVLIGILLGLYVFRWSALLYGPGGGMLSLFLYAFSPNMLAHVRLATHDFGLIASMFIAAFYFWRYMKSPRWIPLLLCGLFSGLALLAKTTAIFLGPVFAAFVVISILLKNGLGLDHRMPWVSRIADTDPRLGQALTAVFSFAIIGITTLLVLNLGYGFQGMERPLPIPGPFLSMLKIQSGTVASLGNVYFAGNLNPNGLWHLTITSFLIKTPLAFLLILVGAIIVFARNWRRSPAAWLILSFVGCLVFVFSFLVESGTGLRYILPIYPFLHVFAGSVLPTVIRWKPALRIAFVVLPVWYLASSFSIFPHYLAYFNEFVGGPKNGYKMLTDANLDWGQDLKGLAAWVKKHRIEKVNLGYFGSADATYYGIDYNYLPSVGLNPGPEGQWWYDRTTPYPRIEPESGVYAISASLISSQGWMKRDFHDAYSVFRDREPDDQIGYSIQIFHIRDSEVVAPQTEVNSSSPGE